MNKTKSILAGFAVFASILMLSATCIAAPVQQSVSIQAVESTAVESTQQELINSFEAMASQIKNDPLINSFLGKISSDTTLNSKVSAIANTQDPKIQMSLVTSLKAYISSKYSVDLQKISASLSKNYGISPGTIDPAKSTWPGFMCSINGSIYVPGVGWISKTDPYYNYWLALEGYLSYADLQDLIVLIFLIIIFLTPPGWLLEVGIGDLWWLSVTIVAWGAGVPFPGILIIVTNTLFAPLYWWLFYMISIYHPTIP